MTFQDLPNCSFRKHFEHHFIQFAISLKLFYLWKCQTYFAAPCVLKAIIISDLIKKEGASKCMQIKFETPSTSVSTS